MAAIDIAGFVTDLKDHAIEHGFHVHDERHFVETYSLRQSWEVDLHPEAACGGPLDLHLALEVDARVLLSFEDHLMTLENEFAEPTDEYRLPLYFNWGLPPLAAPPDLLILATDIAGVGGTELPLEISSTDAYAAVADSADRRLSVIGRVEVSLADVFMGRQQLCEVLDRGRDVSAYLLDRVDAWIDGR